MRPDEGERGHRCANSGSARPTCSCEDIQLVQRGMCPCFQTLMAWFELSFSFLELLAMKAYTPIVLLRACAFDVC